MRYLMLLLLCVGCMEVDELEDMGEGVEKSLGMEYCGGGSRREVYDYLLGVVDREYLIGEVLYIWHEESVVILELDYMKGSPEDDYLIGREVCYW